MSSIYVVRRTAAEQIGIDAGLTVLGFVLGAVLLSWTGAGRFLLLTRSSPWGLSGPLRLRSCASCGA